jgi:hypothetical protein
MARVYPRARSGTGSPEPRARTALPSPDGVSGGAAVSGFEGSGVAANGTSPPKLSESFTG